MKTLFSFALILFLANAQSQKILVPYLDKIDESRLCGGSNCCPSIGTCGNIKEGYFFKEIKDVLGNIMIGRETIFDANLFAVPTDNDIEVSAANYVDGTLDQTRKTEFSSNLEAKLTPFLSKLSPDIKAEFLAQFKKSVDDNYKSQVSFEQYTATLSKRFIKNSIANQKFDQKSYVITGLSYFVISGNWTSGTLTSTFKNFEATAAYKSLDADAKAEFDKVKNLTLNANFKISSVAFKLSYKTYNKTK